MTLGQPMAVWANEINYLEDNSDSLWDQENFIDPSGGDFDTSGGEYIADEEATALQEAARAAGNPALNMASALERDKALLPENIIYGLGTGLTIGGWFALLQGSSARDNTRYLGLGVVGGVLLGLMVGTKSIYKPAFSSNGYQLDSVPEYKIPLFQPSYKDGMAGIDLNFKF